jgi:hypothetical protein
MVAFKEWSLVCQALGEGRQSIILRKGGIHEGKSGFSWKHDRFALFPTHFHEQKQHLRSTAGIILAEPDLTSHTIKYTAEIVHKVLLTDWEQVRALQPYHDWTESMIRERFDYTGDQTISLAVLRVYRLAEPLTFPDVPGYGGCRSWVQVPDPTDLTQTPVLTEDEQEARLQTLLSMIGSA